MDLYSRSSSTIIIGTDRKRGIATHHHISIVGLLMTKTKNNNPELRVAYNDSYRIHPSDLLWEASSRGLALRIIR